MRKGRDVLIVYDDLSKHAVAYRTLSLLLERSPDGRPTPAMCSICTPSAGAFRPPLGGIGRRQHDGAAHRGDPGWRRVRLHPHQHHFHYRRPDLFGEQSVLLGQRPAVNVGLSVSRVGGDAQTKAMKKAAGALRLDLAQYREMEVFTQFSSDLDETTKRQLIYGQGLMRLLRQPQNHPYQQHQQVILLVAALDHVMQTVPLARMDDFRTGLLTYIETQDQALCRRIDESGQLSDEDRETILKLSREFLTRFQTEAAEKSGE